MSKERAPNSILAIEPTLLVSQLPMSMLKTLADSNMLSMHVTYQHTCTISPNTSMAEGIQDTAKERGHTLR